MTKGKSALTPSRWWQWVLMYPALIIALIGHIPTLYQLYQSKKINVPFSDTGTALKENNIFKYYAKCLNEKPFKPVPSSDKVSVSVIACPPALFVLIQSHDPAVPSGLRAFALADISRESRAGSIGSLFIKEALAEDSLAPLRITQAEPIVICQKWLADGRLLVRIRYPNGQCFDQTVNTYTGIIISTVPAPCDPNCK